MFQSSERSALKSESWRLSKLLPLLFIALGFSLYAAAQDEPARRILVLNADGFLFPAINVIDQAIYKALMNSPVRLELYYEHMDANLFPDPSDQQRFRDFYIRKYENRRPDVVITVGPLPLRFMLDTHQKAFAGVPVIFCLQNGTVSSDAVTDPDFTGVDSDIAPVETLEVALRLRPRTKHVIVAGGSDDYDKQTEAVLKRQLHVYEDRLDFVYLTDLAMPDLLERLRHPPANSVILFTSMGRDAAGKQFIPGSESGPMIAAAANAPFFSLADVYLNHGEVGGYVSDLSKQGKIAGGMALRILNGEKPRDIPRAKGAMTYMFDWRVLKRWGMSERDLPVGSIVINRQPTIWESYKPYIIGGISLVLVETVLILGLLWNRRRRREAEAQLTKSFETVRESEGRFRLVANTAPVMIWMSGPDKLRNYCNQPWLGFTGRSLEQDLGNGWAQGVHSEDSDRCLETYTESFDRRESFEMQYRLRRHDGEYRWVLDFGVPRFNPDGSFAGYIGSCIDITERKLAEEALAEVGSKLIEAHEEERTWIARELHDDINQRIALLAIELEKSAENHDRVRHVGHGLHELGKDIQALSHRLHSSKLDYLGLAAAANSFCTELAEQQKIEIHFSHAGVPNGLPKEVSLCLFRVLQEALQNAVKHSGVRYFTVELHGRSGEIQMVVGDLGVGFDQENAVNLRGLGLISMRERLQMVKGQLSIKSEPGRGTTIRARVPFGSSDHANAS